MAQTAGELAQQVVGGAVVRLSIVAEAIGFDVEDAVELLGRFVWQRFVDFDAAGVNEYVAWGRSRLYALVNPVTAPPNGAVAPFSP